MVKPFFFFNYEAHFHSLVIIKVAIIKVFCSKWGELYKLLVVDAAAKLGLHPKQWLRSIFGS